MNYDVIIIGGGTAGVAAAYTCAKNGLKTLLVEKTDVLGGAVTQGLVIPSMKVNTENINTDFLFSLKEFADKISARHTYLDGNEYWFNPELLKIVFDRMLDSVKCNVLFSSEPVNIVYDDIFKVTLEHKILLLYLETKYIIDATSNGKIFKLLNCNFQNSDERKQNPSLRFIVSGIDIEKFADWLLSIDSDRNVTTVHKGNSQIHLSTAYTWDTSRNWALRGIFETAIKNNDLEYEDTAYFQVFTVPQMHTALAFNCPRIILSDSENQNNPFVYSKALKQGRERVLRLHKFCVKYFPGFSDSYISHISDLLGVRESYRVKCKYTMTKEDIISGKKPENIALSCDYPIDIHSNNAKSDKLEFTKHNYYLPIEALISDKYENLYAAGRIVSSDFEAQAALRTQLSCFSMGEAAAKDIINKIKN